MPLVAIGSRRRVLPVTYATNNSDAVHCHRNTEVVGKNGQWWIIHGLIPRRLIDKRIMASSSQLNKRTNLFLTIFFIVSVSFLVFGLLTKAQFSPDSWSYLELSKTVFHDFYRINTYRHFQNEIPYGMSFPPLWPVVIAVLDFVTGLGIYTGYFANFLIVILIAFISERTVGRSLGLPGAGFLSMSVLLCYEPFIAEATAARSIPLALLWLAILLHLFTSKYAERMSVAFAMGLVAGLAVMTRFDFLLASAALVVPYALRSRRLSSAAVYLAGWFTAISPWMIYSWVKIGVVFATDNSRVARAAQTDFVTNFVLYPLPTIGDAPLQWLMKCLENTLKIIESIKYGILLPVNSTTIFLSVEGVLICALIASLVTKWRFLEYLRPARARPQQLSFLGFSLIFLVHVLGPITTGYPDTRYFAPAIWFATMLASRAIPPGGASLIVPGLAILFLVSLDIKVAVQNSTLFPVLSLDERNVELGQFEPITSCLTPDSGILFIGNDTAAAKFGALAGYRVALEPRNLTTLGHYERQIFLARFKLRYLVAQDDVSRTRAHRYFELSPMDGCEASVFRIKGVKAQ